MFKAEKLLNQKKLENLKIKDSEGKHIVNPTEIKEIITGHFKSKFRQKHRRYPTIRWTTKTTIERHYSKRSKRRHQQTQQWTRSREIQYM